MKLVGLIGEAPHDTNSISNLLKPVYEGEINFVTLINDIHGSQLDEQKTKRFLRKEYEFQKPDLIIFIRDLDALENDKTKLNLLKKYFTDFNSVVDKKGLFLLNIYEIEALILADIEPFNREYQLELEQVEDPMLIPEPKEYLKDRTKPPKKFKESDNPDLFLKLRFQHLKSCRYFSQFITEFEERIKA